MVLAAPALHGGLLARAASAAAAPKAACEDPPWFDAAAATAALVGKDLVYASAAECELAAAALTAYAVAAGAPPGTTVGCGQLHYPGRLQLSSTDCAEVARHLGTYSRRVHGPEAGFLCARGGVLYASTAGCESAAAAADTIAATPPGACWLLGAVPCSRRGPGEQWGEGHHSSERKRCHHIRASGRGATTFERAAAGGQLIGLARRPPQAGFIVLL